MCSRSRNASCQMSPHFLIALQTPLTRLSFGKILMFRHQTALVYKSEIQITEMLIPEEYLSVELHNLIFLPIHSLQFLKYHKTAFWFSYIYYHQTLPTSIGLSSLFLQWSKWHSSQRVEKGQKVKFLKAEFIRFFFVFHNQNENWQFKTKAYSKS